MKGPRNKTIYTGCILVPFLALDQNPCRTVSGPWHKSCYEDFCCWPKVHSRRFGKTIFAFCIFAGRMLKPTKNSLPWTTAPPKAMCSSAALTQDLKTGNLQNTSTLLLLTLKDLFLRLGAYLAPNLALLLVLPISQFNSLIWQETNSV